MRSSLTSGGTKRAGQVKGIARSLDSHIQSGTCIGYTFKNGNQSTILSVQSAIDGGGFDFWYLTIQIDMERGTFLEDTSIVPPKVMEWLPIRYGGGIERQFTFKHANMGTRERYIVEVLHPLILATLFTHIPAVLDCKGYCAVEYLSPVPLGVYEWWQPFLCVVCGKTYLCGCFQDAVEKHAYLSATCQMGKKAIRYKTFLEQRQKLDTGLRFVIFAQGHLQVCSTVLRCMEAKSRSDTVLTYRKYLLKRVFRNAMQRMK